MKIAFVTEYLAPKDKPYFGGVDARTINLAKHLVKDHDVHIVTTLINDTDKYEDYDNVKIHRIGKNRKFTQRGDFLQRLRFNSDIISEIVKLQPDIVDASGFVSYSGGYKGAKKIDVPAVVTVHEVWQGEWAQNMGLINGFIGHFLEKNYLSRQYDGYVAVSNFTRSKLINKIGIQEEKIEVVPNGIDLELYKSVQIDNKYEHPTIVTVCRLVSYKRVDDLIKAVKILKLEFPDVKLKIIGIGPQARYLMDLSKELELENNIDFLGKISDTKDVIRILKKSDVFVLPSIVEGFGMVVLEAMASGVPYVISDISPLREITGSIGGLFFEPKNYKELADNIRRLLDETSLKKDLMKDVEKYVEKFDWNLASVKAETFYGSLIIY